MKKTLLIIASLLFITSTAFPQSKVNVNSLKEYGGKAFKVDDDEPYTGRVFDLNESTGKKTLQGQYKNGHKIRKWTRWHSNGKKKREGNYKDGKRDGLWTQWYENGRKMSEMTYKDGVRWDGKWTIWYGDEYKLYEETYKDGQQDGLWTSWYDDGQKSSEGTYKYGELDGLWSEWDDNGQVQVEGTYKDGKRDGLWTWWRDNGQKKIIYKKGEIKNILFNGNEIWIPKYLDRKIPNSECISLDSNGIVYVSDIYTFIWEKNEKPSTVFSNVIENLTKAGAWIIIFDSAIPGIDSWDVEELLKGLTDYVYDKENSKIFWALNDSDKDSLRVNFCPEGLNLKSSPPIYNTEQIMDTQDYDLPEALEDVDWMSQFLPGQVPEWVLSIEDETERNEMMAMLGLGSDFDITQSPFYEKIIIIKNDVNK